MFRWCKLPVHLFVICTVTFIPRGLNFSCLTMPEDLVELTNFFLVSGSRLCMYSSSIMREYNARHTHPSLIVCFPCLHQYQPAWTCKTVIFSRIRLCVFPIHLQEPTPLPRQINSHVSNSVSFHRLPDPVLVVRSSRVLVQIVYSPLPLYIIFTTFTVAFALPLPRLCSHTGWAA